MVALAVWSCGCVYSSLRLLTSDTRGALVGEAETIFLVRLPVCIILFRNFECMGKVVDPGHLQF